MAKTPLPYTTTNNLAKFIKEKAKKEGKSIGQIEEELAKYCSLTFAGTIKKYKDNSIEPSIRAALKICEYFGVLVEEIWKLEEV